ncbi:MAG TPA: hypothetical protein VMU04_07520 [Candidatus Acidoferrum sp.]|nr:hypothetical protein [Candidatus Acidoferrum sp.]
MELEAQLKLQAYLDGELPEAEAREMADKLAREAGSAALAAELRQTRALLEGFEEGIRLPESREFFWSKIERDIRLSEKSAASSPALPWAALLRRFLAPAMGLALVAIAGFVLARHGPTLERPGSAVIETALADPGAFTYRDDNSGTTLVWLSYPAENELADAGESADVE